MQFSYFMIIQGVDAGIILDSRKQKTISVSVNGCESASSPNGKSVGKYETLPYYKSLEFCVNFLNSWKNKLEIKKFDDLILIEKDICKKLNLKSARQFGANVLYAFESAILKALAKEKGKELFEIVGSGRKIPHLVGNVVGGGLHSSSISKHPDFQEFLIIPKSENFINNLKAMNWIYSGIGKHLKIRKVNDEGAWLVSIENLEVFNVLNKFRFKAEKKFGIKIEIGIDVASSTLFKRGNYNYAEGKLNSSNQQKLMRELILNNQLYYVEDPFEEHDFKSFSKLQATMGKNCLIVGDDLTATQYNRVVGAIRTKSINSMIIKPNQNGSLFELKKIFDLCKKHKIKTILSHRSGETLDSALSDYAVGFGADYIKCGVATKWREVKLKRLAEIERLL